MAYFSMNGYDSYSGCDIVVTASLKGAGNNNLSHFILGSIQTLSVSTHQDKRPVRSLGNMNAKDYVMGQRTIAGSLVFAVFDRHFADEIMNSAEVIMADEIPALDLTITFANEYGRKSRMVIYGVKLINEGQVMSINDLYTENTYQFVALGMDALKSEGISDSPDKESDSLNRIRGNGRSRSLTPIYDPLASSVKKDFEEASGKEISDTIKNNIDYSNKLSIILSSNIEQPSLGETTGIVNLTIEPNQNEGFIYITNLITDEVDHTIFVDGSNSYNLELPIGFYNAKYMNTIRSVESNLEKVTVRLSENVAAKNLKALAAYPVIENITNNSISVTMYNNDFNSIICYSSGDIEFVQDNNNLVVFNNLKSDTTYYIYAVNENTESNVINITTLPDSMTYYNKFIDYLSSNRGMIQNDYDAMIKEVNSLLKNTQWPYDNIIDGISLLENSLLKQELLLYATLFENSMIEAYNLKNPYRLDITRNNIFDSNLSINNWNTTKYYSIKNNKNILEGVLNENNKAFNGRPNTAYSFYGINEDNSSIKQYISVFSAEGKEFLEKYKDINKYQALDLSYNKGLHPTLNNEELYAITIRDNFLCDKYLLEEPHIYIEDDRIYADVTYDDKILLDDIYYLCISEMYSTLDVVPKRKETFNRQTKIIDLTASYMPFNENKIYHCWVENYQGLVISKAFIFNYKKSVGLNTSLDKEYLKLLNIKKQLLVGKIDNIALDDIIYDFYSEGVPKKDLNTRLELALLDYGYKSRYVSDVLKDYLYEVVVMNVSNKLNVNRMSSIYISKYDNQMNIKTGIELETKILTKAYDLINKEVFCDIYGSNAMIDIKGDFMAVYLINEFSDKVLGIMVLDCNKYNYKALGFNVEVGDM